jgi:light-harvesting complex 1 beta chain
MNDMADYARGASGYTEEEAREFHAGYMRFFVVWLAVAVIAHVLTWNWKPWFV